MCTIPNQPTNQPYPPTTTTRTTTCQIIKCQNNTRRSICMKGSCLLRVPTHNRRSCLLYPLPRSPYRCRLDLCVLCVYHQRAMSSLIVLSPNNDDSPTTKWTRSSGRKGGCVCGGTCRVVVGECLKKLIVNGRGLYLRVCVFVRLEGLDTEVWFFPTCSMKP